MLGLPGGNGKKGRARGLGLLGGLMILLRGLRAGDPRGWIMTFLGGSMMQANAEEPTQLPPARSTPRNPWWRRYTTRQAAQAKSEPLLEEPKMLDSFPAIGAAQNNDPYRQ